MTRVLFLIAALALPAGVATSQDDPSATMQPRAAEVLRAVMTYIGETEKFSYTAQTSFEVLQDWGMKLEFPGRRTVSVERPDRLHVRAERDGRAREIWLRDGSLTIVEHGKNAYATLRVPQGLDGALDHVQAQLGVQIPLAGLLYSDAHERFGGRLTGGVYVGLEIVGDVSCHHVIYRSDDIDWQAWVDAGDRPLPRKVIITYKTLPGAPQFRAHFTSWNTSPPPMDSRSSFSPPRTARRVPFVPMPPEMTPSATGGEQ